MGKRKNAKKMPKIVKNGRSIEVMANKKTTRAATQLAKGMAKTSKKMRKSHDEVASVPEVRILEAQIVEEPEPEQWREKPIGENLLEEERVRNAQSLLPEMRRRVRHFSWIKAVLGTLVIAILLFSGVGIGKAATEMISKVMAGDEASLFMRNGEAVALGCQGERMAHRVGLFSGMNADDEAQKKKNEQLYLQNLANSGKKLVALTFDDGPSYATTARLLDVLKSKNVKATFFVVGSMMRRAPDLVQREVAEGHEVGSHTMGHVNLSLLNAAETRAEVESMNQLFMDVLGRSAEVMRPPYGNFTDVTKANVGMPMIYWTVDTLDWKYRDPETVRQNVRAAVFDGAIILMHDIHSTTVDAIANVIDDLRAQGYEFLTVTELAKARGVTLDNGGVYGGFRP